MPDSTPSPPPAVYRLLREPPNLAVESAILAGLPDLSPVEQEAALDTLVARGRDRRLVELLSAFERWGPELQKRILARGDHLYAAARLGVADEAQETRLAVIEFIRRTGDCKLAYLLADGLRHLCPKTRERAARALTELTAAYLSRYPTGTGPTAAVGETRTDGDYLARALARAVRTWELHFRPEVLRAAMWMAERIADVFFEEVAEPRSKLARAVGKVLTASDDGRLAGFAVRALLCPTLRSEVARTIEASSHPAFARGLMAESWLLADRSIAKAWRRIHRLAWLDEGTVCL
ncbi:MAG: hypothetical protein IID40_09585, partial [Planctomycetes bacterium]|nr:hypothetical protein [Planctomycetota bacterium]